MPRMLPTLVYALALALAAPSAFAKRDKPLTAVADLRYGAALYNYYLDDYMAAMTELLIAEERGGISGHGDNPEIMEGGLAMGYSMERYASEIFERLLEQNRSDEVQDVAWFYLAKLRYGKGDWVRTLEALDKIQKKPEKNLRKEAAALRISVLLKQENPDAAADLIEKVNITERLEPYYYFNIGSAFARQGRYPQAVYYFSELAEERYDAEEHRALYDKAMTAAGYSYLFMERFADAKLFFSRVRLNSKLKNRALLGYGWASVELGDYHAALKPWLHLANSPIVDENNQEALIAVPYAYEKLGATSLALEHYQKAENSFLEEIDKIDTALDSVLNENLLSALRVDARGELDWMSIAEEKQLSPRVTYLVKLFSRNEFQASIYELQDLLVIRDGLVGWQDKLAFYEDMIGEREQFRAEQANLAKIAELKQSVATMQGDRQAFTTHLEQVVASNDFFALSTDDEQDLINRAKRSLDNVEALRDSDPFIDEYEEAARRYYGLLMWQASERFGDRLWQSIKGLNKLDKALAETEQLEIRIRSLVEQAPDLNPYQVKMDAANDKLMWLNTKIDEAIRDSEIDLRDEVVALLQAQKIRLRNYLAQSRLAVARIYDTARKDYEATEFEKLKSEAEKAATAADDASLEDSGSEMSGVPRLDLAPLPENTPATEAIQAEGSANDSSDSSSELEAPANVEVEPADD